MAQLIDIRRPLNVCRASAGTGKTFTLAAYYVGLLLSGVDYRSILAVTFTNKATAEMRERIMSYLYGIANGGEDAFLARAKEFMVNRREAAGDRREEELMKRAGECFRAMLLDYDNMHVMTIDSFLQTLLSGLASVLKMSAGLNTELDVDHVIAEAVDQLLTTELSEADEEILKKYMLFKLDQESKWDIRQSLCSMAKELYNESVQMLDAEGQIVFDAAAIETARQKIEASWQEDEQTGRLRRLLATIHPEEWVYEKSVSTKTLPHAKDVERALRRLQQSVDAPDKMPPADRFRGLTDKQYEDAPNWSKLPPDGVAAIMEATVTARVCLRRYNTIRLTVQFSRDMQLMASLQAIIRRNLHEANSVLLAQTANTLCRALKQGDADFILEKAGIRYRHILIDEFQDTSRLQWNVMRQLVNDVLAGEGHTLLIVGDIKQSIYRWRNGDWHIMADLGRDAAHYSEQINNDFPQLTRNFRSSEQVVGFNLSLFRYIMDAYEAAEPGEKELVGSIYDEGFSPETLDEYYQFDKKRGGYVRFRAFPKRRTTATPDDAPEMTVSTREAMTMDMFDTMETLLEQGALPSQMMVLVRERREAAYITDLHAQADADRWPHLKGTAIVSADSFLLEASPAVNTVINALRYLHTGDEVAAKYVETVTGSIEKTEALRPLAQSPLFEQVSEIINRLFTDEDGQYHGSETAYLNNLLDRVRDYVGTYGSRVDDFLAYWDDTMHSKPIPASATDAIRILTVHASKGLQAQTLFIPFCTWTREAGAHHEKIWCEASAEMNAAAQTALRCVPIQDGDMMAESDYEADYRREHINMRVDNLNMLYVALTRAEDNLYISADFPVTSKNTAGVCNHVGQYLLDHTGLSEQIVAEDLAQTPDGAAYAEYSAGEPVIKQPNAQRTAAKTEEPFSFSGVETETAELWSSSAQVRFVQSQEGALYTDYGEEAYRRVARIEEGTLCHEIFARLQTKDQLDYVLDEFESRGEIATPTQRAELKAMITSAWEGSKEMNSWFTDPWQLRLEEAVYIDRRELRPDRVMINPLTNEAIVLDYKFGHWEDKYITQVNEYMEALRRLGHSPVRGYLWFARRPAGKQLIEVERKEVTHG